jgi:DNA-binding transcriptional LysR family regulator
VKSYDLNLLAALDALLSTASVTDAAQRMHLSTPAMSHTLARIRRLIDDPILVRAGRQLVPTPRAIELKDPVHRLVAQANAILAPQIDAGLARVNRFFTIRAPDGVSVVFGAQLSIALQQVMPAASMQFLSEGYSDVSALREGRVDLDVGSIQQKDPEVEAELLTEQNLVGAVSIEHPLLKGKMTAKRFAAERHVGVTPRHLELSPVDSALAKLGLSRFVAMTVHSSHGALVVAARTQLVATALEPMATSMQAFIGLEVFDLPLKLPKVPMLLAWHPRNTSDPAHAALRDCFRSVLGDSNWQRRSGPAL